MMAALRVHTQADQRTEVVDSALALIETCSTPDHKLNEPDSGDIFRIQLSSFTVTTISIDGTDKMHLVHHQWIRMNQLASLLKFTYSMFSFTASAYSGTRG